LISIYNKLAGSEKFITFSARTIVKQIYVGIAVTLLVIILLSLVL
jgi:hypothetical protein